VREAGPGPAGLSRQSISARQGEQPLDRSILASVRRPTIKSFWLRHALRSKRPAGVGGPCRVRLPHSHTSSTIGPVSSNKIQAYVFVDTTNPGPKRIVKRLREIPGVVRADALFGLPDILALVEGDDVAAMDEVIDRIVEIDGVIDTESKVVRWV
jgi:DNA-binding Lrp family transcriptional regulator